MPYDKLIYRLTLVMAATIFFQQVFVINVGGSFKIYELVGFLMAALLVIHRKKFLLDRRYLPMTLFFLVAPIFSYVAFYFISDVDAYYVQYPDAKEVLRFNYNFSIPILYLYYAMVLAVYIQISESAEVYRNKNTILRTFVLAGTLVSMYSLYGSIGVHFGGLPDLIPELVDFRNTKPADNFRPAGFSIEPGTYIFMQLSTILFLLYHRNLFSKAVRRTLILVNGSVGILTFSSLIMAFPIAIGIFEFVRRGFKERLRFLLVLSILTVAFFFLSEAFDVLKVLRYALFDKILHFVGIGTKANILSIDESGVYRAFTTALGLQTFSDHPVFGVGPGNAVFFAWRYLERLGPITPPITFFVVPQNTYAQVLAETGIFGGLLLLFHLGSYFRNLSRQLDRFRDDPVLVLGFIGLFMTLLSLFAIFPLHSLFIWLPLALVYNEVRFKEREPSVL